VQTLVNAIREEEASQRGIAYDQILDASGKEDLGGGVSTGITAALRSTWKLNFATGAYQATISGGNVADVLQRVNNTGSPQVVALSSAAATVVATGSGVTAQDKTDIAAATMAAAQVTPIWADVRKVRGTALKGYGIAPTFAPDGTMTDPGDPWLPDI
ncbi:MAG: hypothetical protein ACRCV5_03645, partial [Afipia sp.]